MFTVLEHDVDVFSIVEIPVKLDYIRMVESPLDLKLTFHLREEVELFEHVFKDNFECNRRSRAPFDSFEHFAELTAADCLNS